MLLHQAIAYTTKVQVLLLNNLLTRTHREEMQEGDMVTPGFRFYPIEEELVSFYLGHKLEGTRPDIDQVIREVDIYAIEPWDLPGDIIL